MTLSPSVQEFEELYETYDCSHLLEGFTGYKRGYNPIHLAYEPMHENVARKGCQLAFARALTKNLGSDVPRVYRTLVIDSLSEDTQLEWPYDVFKNATKVFSRYFAYDTFVDAANEVRMDGQQFAPLECPPYLRAFTTRRCTIACAI